MSADKGPPIECVKCGKVNGLYDYALDEAATLTCPVCGTQFLITASLKEPVKPPANKPPGTSDTEMPVSSAPSPPATPTGPPSSPQTSPLPAERWTGRVDNMMESINSGCSVDDALAILLGEEDKKHRDDAEIEGKEWKGDLAAFNTKLQSLAKDIGYEGDLGDLVRDLLEDEALVVKGENLTLDLGKAKVCLVKHVIGNAAKKPSFEDSNSEITMDKDVNFEGSLMQQDPDVGAPPSMSRPELDMGPESDIGGVKTIARPSPSIRSPSIGSKGFSGMPSLGVVGSQAEPVVRMTVAKSLETYFG